MANTCKFYKEKRYVSHDNGNTWQGLNEYRKGRLYEPNSVDCIGGVEYTFFELDGEYICDYYAKYRKSQKFQSSNGIDWEPVTPYVFGHIGDAIYDDKLKTSDINMDCFKAYWWFHNTSTSWDRTSYTADCNNSPILTRSDMQYLPMGYTSSTITKVAVGNCVTSINQIRPFNNEKSYIASLILPDSLREIGGNSCVSSLHINNLDIPSGVTAIGGSAFSHNYIGSTYLPRGLQTLGDHAFFDCSGFTTINSDMIPPNITTIPSGCFGGCNDVTTVDIPEGVTEINSSAFDGLTKLKSLTLPQSLTRINDGGAFCCGWDDDNYYYNEVTIPSGVTYIGDRAFNSAHIRIFHIKSTTPPTINDINNTLSTFNNYHTGAESMIIYVPCESFEDYWNDSHWGVYHNYLRPESGECEPLYSYQEITKDDSQDWMCVNGTKYNKSYYSVSYNNGHTWYPVVPMQYQQGTIKTSQGDNCKGDRTIKLQWINIDGSTGWKYGNTNGNDSISNGNQPGMKSAIISDSVTKIDSSAFSGSKYLENIVIPNSVSGSIGTWAFEFCDSLTSVTMSNYITKIKQQAFRGCKSLESITLPSGITTIDISAFDSCVNLKNVTILATTPPSVDTTYGAFNNCHPDLKIYVPCESFAAYQNDRRWSYYSDKLAPIQPCTLPSVKYQLVFSSGGTKTIYCDNSGYIFSKNDITNFGKKDDLTNVTLYDCVSSISANSFYECSNLNSVTMQNSVTSIGEYAFYYCEKLTNVNLPTGLTSIDRCTFAGCEKLSNITIPSGVTSIGVQAFQTCNGLTSINLPSGLTDIGNYAFNGCISLTNITIPDSVTTIGESAFDRCSGLTIVTIGSSVTSIGNAAFQYCNSLTSVTIPDSVTSIGDYAFFQCSGLTSVAIPNSVTSLGTNVFDNCTSLSSVTIPNSVTSIGDSAFYNCSKLINVTIPNSVTSIGRYAFFECSGLTSVAIPNSVTSLGTNVFDGCISITSVTIGSGVTTISNSAFNNCSGLTSITIPDSVTSIGDDAFYKCTNLTSITLPSGVTSIGGYAFNNCKSLTSVTVNALTPPKLGTSAFDNTNDCPIYVPAASVDAYKEAYIWYTYTSRIQPIPNS